MFQALVIFITARLPGGQRQKILRRLFGHEVHPTARIGFCLISVEHLYMAEGSGIGALTVIRGLRRCELHEEADIGRLNWISALPVDEEHFFRTVKDRDPSLIVGRGSVIMHRHLIDCNARVEIGELSGIAGYRCSVITHGVDIRENTQSAQPVYIGDRTMIASNCVILGGSTVPDRSVVAAGSSFRGEHAEPGLYAGVPAKRVGDLPEDAKFFHRTTKMIY
jgi:acetyltransferase-like isoleucine patch superfamily enzyme